VTALGTAALVAAAITGIVRLPDVAPTADGPSAVTVFETGTDDTERGFATSLLSVEAVDVQTDTVPPPPRNDGDPNRGRGDGGERRGKPGAERPRRSGDGDA